MRIHNFIKTQGRFWGPRRFLVTAISMLFLALLFWGLAIAVNAQEGPPVPPPYAGLKNPFPWNDPQVQQEGKKLYQRSCQACHGTDGSNIASANFGAAGFSEHLEEEPDFHLWITSEGRLSKGMPPFKSSLSTEQQWQILTYTWSLSKAKEAPTSPKDDLPVEGVTLSLTAPQVVPIGQTLTLTATLKDAQGKPVEDATVAFFTRQEFFMSGLMEIGQRKTDDKGTAFIKYMPREERQMEVLARYKTVETKSVLNVTDSQAPSYQAEAGIKLPTIGEEVFIGPGAQGLGELGEAPRFAFRLPGGIITWPLILVITVAVIWATYFRVLYQVFRIPIRGEITDTDTRLLPLIGLAAVIAIGIFLALKFITSPHSHPNLLP